ncbi:MAG TPA: hypothetical protein VGD75_03290, partial [Bradyrhizobium sp.]
AIAMGLAVEFLMRQPAFAKLPFGRWSGILLGQIKRGHYYFVVDERRSVHGMLGWALTNQATAERWIKGRMQMRSEDCQEGDCVVVNVLAVESSAANRAVAEAAIKVFEGKRLFYAKRYYADGRTRPMCHPPKIWAAILRQAHRSQRAPTKTN